MKKLSFVTLFVVIGVLLSLTVVVLANGDDVNPGELCHVPPGNPEQAHVIPADDHSWDAHFAHGDFLVTEATPCPPETEEPEEPEVCEWDETLPADSDLCVEPEEPEVCEWDETLPADSDLCVEPEEPEEPSITVVAPSPLIETQTFMSENPSWNGVAVYQVYWLNRYGGEQLMIEDVVGVYGDFSYVFTLGSLDLPVVFNTYVNGELVQQNWVDQTGMVHYSAMVGELEFRENGGRSFWPIPDNYFYE